MLPINAFVIFRITGQFTRLPELRWQTQKRPDFFGDALESENLKNQIDCRQPLIKG